jgi:hypothetical protein
VNILLSTLTEASKSSSLNSERDIAKHYRPSVLNLIVREFTQTDAGLLALAGLADVEVGLCTHFIFLRLAGRGRGATPL